MREPRLIYAFNYLPRQDTLCSYHAKHRLSSMDYPNRYSGCNELERLRSVTCRRFRSFYLRAAWERKAAKDYEPPWQPRHLILNRSAIYSTIIRRLDQRQTGRITARYLTVRLLCYLPSIADAESMLLAASSHQAQAAVRSSVSPDPIRGQPVPHRPEGLLCRVR